MNKGTPRSRAYQTSCGRKPTFKEETVISIAEERKILGPAFKRFMQKRGFIMRPEVNGARILPQTA